MSLAVICKNMFYRYLISVFTEINCIMIQMYYNVVDFVNNIRFVSATQFQQDLIDKMDVRKYVVFNSFKRTVDGLCKRVSTKFYK